MTRLPEVTRDALPQQLREAFDELVAANDGKVPAGGPAGVTINSPEMVRRRRPLSNYLRFETKIPEHILELAILTSARCMDCPYVWNAHASAARRAGVSDALIDALRDNHPLPAIGADESAVVQFGMELFKTHGVNEDTFQAALGQFGPRQLVDLTALMGYYAQTAFFLNAFAVELPDRQGEPQLPV